VSDDSDRRVVVQQTVTNTIHYGFQEHVSENKKWWLVRGDAEISMGGGVKVAYTDDG
jgi:hypothetical protein